MAGGAHIVDAKEPALGPLSPVSPATLQSICAAVPPEVSLSVALGDARSTELGDVVAAVAPMRPRAGLYFKAALVSASARAAQPDMARAARLLQARPDRPELVVARYVDAPDDAADLADWVDACAASGARGLLLDTSRKEGGNLLASVDVRSLAALRRRATRHGVWLAVAGGMTVDDMERLGEIRPHVVGVRGAVCVGGRAGSLSIERVRQLRHALDAITARPGPRALPA